MKPQLIVAFFAVLAASVKGQNYTCYRNDMFLLVDMSLSIVRDNPMCQKSFDMDCWPYILEASEEVMNTMRDNHRGWQTEGDLRKECGADPPFRVKIIPYNNIGV